jgi:hypothetical protein
MISNHNIYRAARALIARFGDEAQMEATRRADRYFDRGDIEARATWHRIGQAIVDLQTRPRGQSN